jgi:hypothetical protein
LENQTEETEMNIKIESAIPKPYTNHPGVSKYPWADVEVGQGFHIPDLVVDGLPIKRRAGDLRTTGVQWAKRRANQTQWEAFRYDHPENGPGVQINRTL